MIYSTTVVKKQWLNRNMIRLQLAKPPKYDYQIGQATELTIGTPEFADKYAPFTFTSLPETSYLEFMIKVYPSHKGLTLALSKINKSSILQITDAWDSYHYKGKGTFIAGGSGITPFIPMLLDLYRKGAMDGHTLLFANKTAQDIVMEPTFNRMLKDRFFNILSEDNSAEYDFGKIDYNYLEQTITAFKDQFYLCGPPGFSEDIKGYLLALGAEEKNIQIGY